MTWAAAFDSLMEVADGAVTDDRRKAGTIMSNDTYQVLHHEGQGWKAVPSAAPNRRPPRGPATVRVARWSAVHPWRAIAAWVIFVILCTVGGGMVGTKTLVDDSNPRTESGHADRIVTAAHFDDPAIENILITARSGSLNHTTALAVAAEATKGLRALAQVSAVEPAVTAANGRAVLVPVSMAGDPNTASDRVSTLQAVTATVQRGHPDLRVEEVGDASLNKAISTTLGGDLHKAELISIPITLVILLVAFGALIAAGVPLLLALSSVAAAVGLSAFASHVIPSSDSITSVILLIGMAVGVDYSLFYVRREREERARGASRLEAIEVAAATSGHSVVVSGIAVTIAMGGLFVARDSTFSSLAVGAILVVLVAVIGSLTVLPALLAKLGHWIDRPRIPVLWRLTAARTGNPRVWSALLKPSLRKPAVTLAVGTVAMVALAIPAFGMTLKLPTASDLPRSIPIMNSYDRLTASFPSSGETHTVAIKAPANELPQVQAAIAELERRVAVDPLFAHDQKPEVRTSADHTVTTVHIGVDAQPGTPLAARSLADIRHILVPQTIGKVPGAVYAVGGDIGGQADFVSSMQASLPWVIAFVLGLTLIVMLVTFRSIAIALTAIGLNLLSAGAAFGVLVLVFQHHWAEGLLGFHSTGAVVAWLPLFLFVVLFGLSMDYHVFVVSRIREAAMRGESTKDAVRHGITSSAGVVTSAAAVMIAVFSVFATLSTIDMKQLGVGLGAAILIDATIVRIVLLPSVMALLGHRNWAAPAWIRRGAPQVPLEAAPKALSRV
ncbi:MMPL family transporter [Acidothermaceae bacterium B102]|nr:MMPL family transporter [Acidothermaceae bacterium B102]